MRSAGEVAYQIQLKIARITTGALRNTRYATNRFLDFHFRKFRKRVVMFHGGRSGSTVLGRMLGRHPDIEWGAELYKHRLKSHPPVATDRSNYLEVLQNVESRAGRRLFGFEMKYWHMRDIGVSFDECVRDMASVGYHNIIVLERRNFLRQFVSSQIGKRHRAFQVGLRRSVVQYSVELDISGLMDVLTEYRDNVINMHRALSGRNYLHLVYEDDVEHGPEIGFQKILDFLDIRHIPILPDLQRVNPGPLTELIVNYGAVSMALKGTEFEWMLDG